MTSTAIVVQGTFDIARGRSILRTHIAFCHWPTHVTARASALLTVLGELILLAEPGATVIVQAEILKDDPPHGVRLACTLHLENMDRRSLQEYYARLDHASDRFDHRSSGKTTRLSAFIGLQAVPQPEEWH